MFHRQEPHQNPNKSTTKCSFFMGHGWNRNRKIVDLMPKKRPLDAFLAKIEASDQWFSKTAIALHVNVGTSVFTIQKHFYVKKYKKMKKWFRAH